MENGLEPIVSVIIPIYNVESFLPQCLESLIRQTLSQIEILCVDDASEDHSAQIVKTYQGQDSRIQLLQQAHQGVSAARNLGILHARGKYLVFVDGDDWVDDNLLERMLVKAEETACDMVVCASQVHFETQDIRRIRRRRSLQAALTVENDFWITDGTMGDVWNALKRPGSWPFVWNKLIRRDLIIKYQLQFSSKLPLGEDGVFLLLLFQYVNKVVFLPERLYHYRYQRKASATERLFQNEVTRFGQHIDVITELLREFSERGLLYKNGKYLLRWILQFLYSDFVRLPAQSRKPFSEKLQKGLSKYDMSTLESELSSIEKKRLKNMLETEKKCTEAKRNWDIIRTKAENRMIRIFCRK